MIPADFPSLAQEAAAQIKEDISHLEKRLEISNAKGGAQRWYMMFVEGGSEVGAVSVSNFGTSGENFLHFWGTNKEKQTVEVIMHVAQLRISLMAVPLERSPEKRPIGFSVE